MDIQKIGNYIKCKGKAQGLTQAELLGITLIGIGWLIFGAVKFSKKEE